MDSNSLPLVTVVTPSYNQRRFLESTLLSVLGQTGPFRLDYVVMDGGSNDGSVDLLADYARRLASGEILAACQGGCAFRWSSEKDHGQAHAINKGFALAEGDILCWLNSDDLYSSSKSLSQVVAFFQARPDARFVYGRGHSINAMGVVTGEERYVTDFAPADLPEIDFILQPSSFWRKEVYQEIGGLNEGMHFAFDWEYWLRIQKRWPVEFLNEFLSCNRIYPETKTNSGGEPRKREIAKLLLELGALTDRSIKAYLAKPCRPLLRPRQQPAVATPVRPFPLPMPPLRAFLYGLSRAAIAPLRVKTRHFRYFVKSRLQAGWREATAML